MTRGPNRLFGLPARHRDRLIFQRLSQARQVAQNRQAACVSCFLRFWIENLIFWAKSSFKEINKDIFDATISTMNFVILTEHLIMTTNILQRITYCLFVYVIYPAVLRFQKNNFPAKYSSFWNFDDTKYKF
jgi:hypothetical protein